MVSESIEHKEIIVKGRVQGVGFRANAKHVADLIGVQGQIKNLPNGNVWIAAEADALILEDFLTWCRSGPAQAVVKELEVVNGNLQHIKGFTILPS